MSQEVGDAVLKFLADSTQLDAKFDEVKPNAEKAFGGAAVAVENFGDAAEEAGQRTRAAMGEARGEVALLGEEFGIRLPRHVRSFIAELPGVGEALTAAFSATAILFVVQAIVQATEKLTKWVSETFIFTEAMKAMESDVAKTNTEILKQRAAMEQAQAALDSFGKSQQQVAHEKVEDLNKKILEQEAIFRQAADNLSLYRDGALDFTKQQVEGFQNTINLAKQTIASLTTQRDKAQLDEATSIGEHQLKVLALKKQGAEALLNLEEQTMMASVANTQNEEQKKYTIAKDFTEKRYQLARNSILQQRSIESQLQKADGVAKLNADLDKLDKEHTQHYEAELEKQKDAFAKALQAISAEAMKQKPEDLQIVTPKAAESLLVYENAALKLGITLKSNLVSAVNTAKSAFDALKESGHALPQELKEAEAAIAKLQKQVDGFGKTTDKFKITEHGLFKQLQEDSKTGATALEGWKQIGTNAMSDVTSAAQSAFTNLLLAQGSFGQALEKATEQILASVASQALIQGLFDVAKSFEAEAAFDYAGAAQYLTASEQMFAVAALAGGAAAGMSRSGGGGGSGSTAQSHTSQSNTTQSNRSGGLISGVQAFADGGLISVPTISLVGERGREAVLPLEDPRAMSQIGQAISEGGGGGTTHHWHVNGMISPDNLAKVVKQISKAVTKGQVHLTASNSLRLTKRSA